MRNIFKVKNKDTRTYFLSFSRVTIVEFEQVNVTLVMFFKIYRKMIVAVPIAVGLDSFCFVKCVLQE